VGRGARHHDRDADELVQASGPLKAMIDRLVCADGRNPGPTSTHSKNAEEAKALEIKGWPHAALAGPLLRRCRPRRCRRRRSAQHALTSWAADMGLVPAGRMLSAKLTSGSPGITRPATLRWIRITAFKGSGQRRVGVGRCRVHEAQRDNDYAGRRSVAIPARNDDVAANQRMPSAFSNWRFVILDRPWIWRRLALP
jgi:hypothetical protein